MLLSKSDMEDNQRVSILAACVHNNGSTEDEDPVKAAKLMTKVKYESIASFLRQ